MFSLLNGIYDSYLAPQSLNLLIVGAQGTGKTTLLERIKVTQFDSRPQTVTTKSPSSLPSQAFFGNQAVVPTETSLREIVEVPFTSTTATKPPNRTTSRRLFICPAPQRYQQATDDDDEEEEHVPLHPPLGRKSAQRSDTQGSMVSVDLEEEQKAPETTVPSQDTKEYDLKPKAKMLPLEKIRPTIGMNLGKVDLCKAKLSVWDVGGKLQELWERYYHDCDAIIFVWKLGETPPCTQSNNDDDDDDPPPPLTPEYQLQLLEKVRSAIPDDVPFLVLGHLFSPMPHCRTDSLYSTSSLLPHYHNPCQSCFFVNARTGQGVKAAMEWLIPLAKRQQRIREKVKVAP